MSGGDELDMATALKLLSVSTSFGISKGNTYLVSFLLIANGLATRATMAASTTDTISARLKMSAVVRSPQKHLLLELGPVGDARTVADHAAATHCSIDPRRHGSVLRRSTSDHPP